MSNEINYNLPNADHFKMSTELYDAILKWNQKHPSAGDEKFLNKINKYHLGTNLRGEQTVANAEKYISKLGYLISRDRFLDLGSGTAGCLLGARTIGWKYSEGWEIGQAKLDFSRLNISSKIVDQSSESIVVRDLSMDGDKVLNTNIEPFDLVICQEVLEHVKNLPRSVQTISRVLKKNNSYAYVSIPNGFSVDYVLSEPHILMYGISLLDRHEAGVIAKAVKNHPHYAEMMGGYHRFKDYIRLFRENGLDYDLVSEVNSSEEAIDRIRITIEKITSERKLFNAKWGKVIDSAIMSRLDEKIQNYLENIESKIRQISDSKNRQERREFVIEYGMPMFLFILHRQ